MLTRIYINNFRCFVGFEYKPASKQLLLGTNGSGKSSLLTAIRYLKQLVKGDENPFTQSTRTRGHDYPLQTFEIDAVLEKQKYEYRVVVRYERSIRSRDIASSGLSIFQEQLRVSGATVFEFAKGKLSYFANNSSRATTVTLDSIDSALPRLQLINSGAGRFTEWMKSVHCFKIDQYPSEMDESADREEREPHYELANLAGWYRYLQRAYPKKNVQFIASMRDALTGFQGLKFSRAVDGTQRLRAEFSGPGKQHVKYVTSELSDGQRCLLGLYMILHFLIARGETVFIDEPDNFIALREIQPWLLAAEEAVERHGGQLILISHHPEILNQWASRNGLRFLRKDNGQVGANKFKVDSPGKLEPAELIARGWENE